MERFNVDNYIPLIWNLTYVEEMKKTKDKQSSREQLQ